MKIVQILVSFLLLYSCFDNEKPEPNPEEPMEFLWEYSYTYEGWGPYMIPTIVGDSLVFITGDNNITCILINSGRVKWTTKVSETWNSTIRNFLYDNRQIYGWQVQEGVFTLNIISGEEVWKYEIGNHDRFGHYHDISFDSYFVGTYDDTTGWFWSFSKDGNVNLRKRIPHAIWSITYLNGKIYCGQGWRDNSILQTVGRVLCLDAINGDSLWAYNTVHGSFISNIPIFDNNVIYSGTVFSESGHNIIVALNADTGDEIWTFSREGQYADYNDIKLVDGVLYCSTNTGVVAISADTGQELWFTEPVFSHNENTLDYWNGYIYIPHTGSLWVLEAETGEIVHKMRGPDKSPVLKVSAGAGKIFVQSSQHLYAFTPYDPEKDND
ncbi:MAG: PQQ-binding-like beta-propeller repeat protein [Fidelibacterota bacterium]